MKVTVSMPATGVFYSPGLARPVVLDTDRLANDVADRIVTLARDANIPGTAPLLSATGSPRTRDGRQCVIHVEDGDRSATLHVAEPPGDMDAPTTDFVRYVLEQAERVRKSGVAEK